MRDQQQPKYLVVGFEAGGGTRYRVERAADLCVCGADRSYPLDDGALVRDVYARTWMSADTAIRYAILLEDDAAGMNGDAPVVWLPPAERKAEGIDWDAVGVLGNIEIDMSAFD